MRELIKKFLMWYFKIKEVPKSNSLEIIDLIKEKDSSKKNYIHIPYRRSGRTTRIANDIIQLFFESKRNEKIIYNDHYFGSRSGDDNLKNIIERRLTDEHRLKKDEHFFSSYNKSGNVLIKKF